MPSRRNARTWIQRGLLATLVGAVLIFGLRATGSVASRLATVDGSVWLVDPPNGVLVQVNALAKDVTAKVPVADAQQQLAAAQVGSGAIVLNRSTSTVGRVDGATFAYEAGGALASPGSDLALVGNDAGAFAVDTSDGKLIALDTADLSTRFEAPISAQQATPAVVDSQGRLWAYDARLGELVRFDGATGDVKRVSVAEPGVVAGLTLVGDRPVVVDPASGQVLRIGSDAAVGQRLCDQDGAKGAARLAVAGSPAGEESALVYALSTDSGELWTTDLDSQRCVTLPLSEDQRNAGDGFGQPVVRNGLLYVPVFTRSQVLVVDGSDNSIDRTVDLRFAIPAGNRFELFTDGGRLWFNDLEGPKAGVLSAAGATLVVDKKELSSVSGVALTDGEGEGGEDAELGIIYSLDDDPAAGSDGISVEPGRTGVTTRPGNGSAAGQGNPGQAVDGGAGQTSPGGTDPSTPATTVPVTVPPAAVVAGPSASGAGPEKKPSPVAVAQPSVSDTPVANFTYSPPGDPTTATQLTFTDASTGVIDAWSWTFTAPDGSSTTATGRSSVRTLTSVGTWTVTLSVSNAAGKTDTTRPLAIQVRDPADLLPPNANFSWDPATPTVRQTVQFRDRSTAGRNSPLTSWFWEFGDGTTSTSQNPPAKSYANPGTYTVRLTVRNSVGANTTEAALKVAEPPTPLKPEFNYSVNGTLNGPITAGQTVLFTDASSGGPTGWAWDFGDGSSGTAPVVGHVFRNADDYSVKLTVTNATGSQSVTRTIRVDQAVTPPVAKIVEPANGVSVEVGKPLRFVSSNTGSPTSVVWEWGDGTRSEGATATHTFATTGPFTVKLTATNAAGASTATVAVVVAPVPPPPPLVAGFRSATGTSTADLAVVGVPVRFVNTSTGTGTFSWNFGDGSTSTEREPSYAFKKVGTFHVTLTMTSGGRTATATGDVYVGPAPVAVVANFDFSPKNPTVGQPVEFIDRTTGVPARWSWSFGDGSAAVSGQTPPPKTFAAAGRFDVTLTTVDRNGAVTTKTQTVVVRAAPRPAPIPAFTVSPASPADQVTGTAITFTDITPALFPLTTPVFTFENSPVSPAAGSRSVEHIFAERGTYPVKMRVCWVDDAANCAEITQDVTISAAVSKPVASFTVSGEGVVPGSNPPVLLINKPVTFTDTSTGEPTAWDWMVRTDRRATQNVTVTLASAGTLNVTLTVTNAAGSSTVTRDYQVLGAAPSAEFTVPGLVVAGEPARFTHPLTALASREWDFGDGTPVVTTTAGVVDHTFAEPGTYTVRLKVTIGGIGGLGSLSATSSKTVTVQPALPAPKIQATNATTGATSALPAITVNIGEAMSFSDIGASSGVTARTWTWSDAVPGGSGATVTRTFTKADSYTVTLQASNVTGTTATSMIVIVLPSTTTSTTTTTTTTTPARA